jgi:hypothetical protein
MDNESIYPKEFYQWLADNGWEMYDSHERYINLKKNNQVRLTKELYEDYLNQK